MKKAVAVLLIIVMLVSCAATAAAAGNSKISENLRQVMNATDDSARIETHILLYCYIDKAEIFRMAIKECGYIGGLPLNMTLEEVYRYKEVYNRLVSDREADAAYAFVDKLDIDDSDIIYIGKTPYVIANLNKEQIIEASGYPEVESLTCIGELPHEEPTELTAEPAEGELYKEKLKAQYGYEDFDPDTWTGDLMDYKELFYHKDSSGETDWALVKATAAQNSPSSLYTVIADRVFRQGVYYAPFSTGYGIYDVAQNKFFDADKIKYGDYPGFVKAFDKYASKDGSGNGRLLGDIDGDDKLTIVDCTLMQRCDVELTKWPDDDIIDPDGIWDYFKPLTYFSDFNRDGDRDIIDITLLQRYVTGIEIPLPVK